jgi:hypothetical protein
MRGRWQDFSTAEYGDLLDLVRLSPSTGAHGDLYPAVVWAHQRLCQPLRPVPRGDGNRAVLATPEETRRYMRQIWREAQPLTRGDLAWRYLVESRAIAGLERLLPLPALRFHPRLRNAQLRCKLPCLVAAVAGADGHFAALHRTFLSLRDGQVGKAPVPKEDGGPKRSLGYFRGGCCPLWPGYGGRSWRDPEPNELVAIAEGLEDALTLAAARPRWRVVCGVSLSNMVVMRLPAALDEVVLVVQNDAPDSPAAKLLRRVIAHFRDDLKRPVSLLKPPSAVKDVNDLQQLLRARLCTPMGIGSASDTSVASIGGSS